MAYFKVGDMVEVTKPDYVLNASEQQAFSKYHNIGMVGDIDQQYVRVEIVGDYAWVKSEYIKLVMSFAPTEHHDAEIARLREQVDTLTRERDAAREALKQAEQRAESERDARIECGRQRQDALDEVRWIKSALRPIATFAKMTLALQENDRPDDRVIMRVGDFKVTIKDFKEAVYWLKEPLIGFVPPAGNEQTTTATDDANALADGGE